MTEQESKKLITETFENDFNEERFKRFIANLLTEYEEKSKLTGGQYIKDAYKPYIESYELIAKFSDSQKKELDVLIAYLKTEQTFTARTRQRNFALDYLKSKAKGAVLIAYVHKNKRDWRFSFVKLESDVIQDEEGRVSDVSIFTAAKRSSFLVGANENSYTAKKQFLPILQKEEKPRFEDIEEAFSVEIVTKEFFNKYRELFHDVHEALEKEIKKKPHIKEEFERKEISTVDFAKKLLGQMVFLYFLQKKGWFGVAPKEKWGTGSKNFLRKLFERKNNYGENFFNDVLEPLFYEALAQDRGQDAIYPRLNNCRMPFLNGGLFEPMRGYSWETTDILLPDELFSNEDKEGEDVGTGILDVFDRYNFTVNESDPLEKEVAVDPEMLGKVFENLLDVKDRKSKGSFYTPREIVHYMCQECLINYLETETKGDILREDIENLLLNGESIIQNDFVTLEKQRKKEEKGFKYSGEYKLKLPKSIQKNARKIDDLLKDVKVCDPAVGSGAFPLGMINEIVGARQVLQVYLRDRLTTYDLKYHAIANSIHGVDLDPGAVDIARLRLWLSLVVEENEPQPLPNLEHRIIQGNSLLSEYEGIKLFDKKLLTNKNEGPLQFLINFGSPVERKLDDLQNKTREYFKESQRSKKQNLKDEIEDLRWEFIEETLKEQNKLEKVDEVRKLREKSVRPFFIWELEFSEVFMKKGGFDIVIGNPPYVKEYTDKSSFKSLKKSPYYMGKMDLWYFFACYGLDVLHAKGIQSFIAPNNWITSYGAKIMRNKFLNETVIHRFIDFVDYKVFNSADIQTMVYLVEKQLDNKGYYVKYGRLKTDVPTRDELWYFLSSSDELNNDIFEKYLCKFSNNEYINKKISFLRPEIKNLVYKIKSGINIYLKENEVAQGIVIPQDRLNRKNCELLGNVYKVGDGIFVLSEEEKDRLRLEENEKNILKPYYDTTNFCKYNTRGVNNNWIIYTDSRFKDTDFIRQFPNIKKHLDKFAQIITSDNKPYGLHRAREERFFKGEKIVVPRKSASPSFSYNNTDCYASATFYVIKPSELNMKYLLGLLNSSLVKFWLRYQGKMQGDNYQIDKEPILEIPIKVISKEEQQPFIDIVDQMLKITSEEDYNPSNPPIKQKELEKKIDEMVYDLYDLSKEEREYIILINKDKNVI